MGISMGAVWTLQRYGMLGAGKKLLDFGSSNLYAAEASDIVSFVQTHNANPRKDLEKWAEKLSAGSKTDANGANLNGSFVGELLEEAGMGYDAVDIAKGYKTEIVDLNTSQLPKKMQGAYDTVVNFGTSEHILNQMNTFAAVHAATKPGGMIMHSVPSIGFVDHGYFCYTSRFFFDLAGYNQYELVDMWYDGSTEGVENVFASARQYQTYFPSLTERLDKIGKDPRETALDAMKIPTIALCIIYRKKTDVPFMGTVETSTSVGKITNAVLTAYRRKK